MLEEIFRAFEFDALLALYEADKKLKTLTRLLKIEYILTTRFIFEDCNFPNTKPNYFSYSRETCQTNQDQIVCLSL